MIVRKAQKFAVFGAGHAGAGFPLFDGKQVASAGWCSAWAKKA
ncbi:MAG: high-potential iron-sulfur protein [Rubrivivax sp.]|jgi:hypothetical protein|nr:high-potential iron-sulfur protein [Rubrivivax sp.]MBK8528603.1 high-potential iron-sulfur protein [Rubrivivax sp.]